jgi:hypothetical protein
MFEFGNMIESNNFLLHKSPVKLLTQVQTVLKLSVLHKPPFKQGELQQAFFFITENNY